MWDGRTDASGRHHAQPTHIATANPHHVGVGAAGWRGAVRVGDIVRAMAGNTSHDPDADASAEASRTPDSPEGAPPGDRAEDLDYGPSGYLPKKASARARKIVLRAPLGLQWVIGALVAGVVVVVAGMVFLSRTGPPKPPFEPTIEVADIEAVTTLDNHEAVAVAAAGPVRVYVVPRSVTLAYCEANGRLQSAGAVWSASSGRGFGVESLARHPSEVHGGVLYVDFSTTIEGPAPTSDPERPGC